jgi:hypothetical protein
MLSKGLVLWVGVGSPSEQAVGDLSDLRGGFYLLIAEMLIINY